MQTTINLPLQSTAPSHANYGLSTLTKYGKPTNVNYCHPILTKFGTLPVQTTSIPLQNTVPYQCKLRPTYPCKIGTPPMLTMAILALQNTTPCHCKLRPPFLCKILLSCLCKIQQSCLCKINYRVIVWWDSSSPLMTTRSMGKHKGSSIGGKEEKGETVLTFNQNSFKYYVTKYICTYKIRHVKCVKHQKGGKEQLIIYQFKLQMLENKTLYSGNNVPLFCIITWSTTVCVRTRTIEKDQQFIS